MDQTYQNSINYIHEYLVPEMIHNRCFCECGSREFVEFDSVVIKPLKKEELNDNREFYRAEVAIKFSGVLKIFRVIIKLLPHNADNNEYTYGRFLNEEIFYNKMIVEYQLDIFPKCYVADMGRYGRPVIVLEDLEAIGYSRNCGLFDEDHIKLCLTAAAKFHARGIILKMKKFDKFREFYAKIMEITSQKDAIISSFHEIYQHAIGDITKIFNETTITHGKFNNHHFLFHYDNCKPTAIKVIGWNGMKHALPTADLESIINNNNTIIKNMGRKNEVDSVKSIECIRKFIDFYRAIYDEELVVTNNKQP